MKNKSAKVPSEPTVAGDSLSPARPLVVTVATHGVPDLELGIPCEVFGVDRTDAVADWYRHEVVTLGDPVCTAAGLNVMPGRAVGAIREADTLVIPAGISMHAGVPAELLEVLAAAKEQGSRIVALCSGAFVLGHAGMLDGRHCTTHWMHAADLASRFPLARVDPDVLYAYDGVWTSGGSTAALDLCLHLVRLDKGPRVANLVARRVVVAPHRAGGQRVHIPPVTGDAPVRVATGAQRVDPWEEALAWAEQHLAEASVARIASRSHLSPRTLNRRMSQWFGCTPQAWLLERRIAQTQSLLEGTDLTIAAIATHVGFGTAVNLRQHFKGILGMTPGQYRSMYRPPAAT